MVEIVQIHGRELQQHFGCTVLLRFEFFQWLSLPNSARYWNLSGLRPADLVTAGNLVERAFFRIATFIAWVFPRRLQLRLWAGQTLSLRNLSLALA